METTIDISDFRLRQVALSEIFSTIEKQTDLRFIYVASQLPLDATMSFESGDYITLARLFTAISAMVDITLLRHEKKIIVRSIAKHANGGDSRITRAAGSPNTQPISIA
ncbi:hypothetical protein OH491_18835 [Termitidicoccus mucosus]